MKVLPLLLVVTVFLTTVLLAEVAHATFPGANGKIAFERGNETAEHDIYAINPDGTGEINLTHNGGNNRRIAWSPDGSQIAFFSDGDGRDNYYDIHVANADGGGSPIRVTYTGNANYPAWSPDGRSIAFSDEFLYTVHSDGSGLRALTGTGRSASPAWSPDGSKIAFGHYDGFTSSFTWSTRTARASEGSQMTSSVRTAFRAGLLTGRRSPTPPCATPVARAPVASRST